MTMPRARTRTHRYFPAGGRRRSTSAAACSYADTACGCSYHAVPPGDGQDDQQEHVTGQLCEHGCRPAGAGSASPPPAPRAHPGRCRCSPAARSRPRLAARRGWHRLAGQRECPGDDDELTGGHADGEGISVCRFQDPQDVSHLLAAVPRGTAPAEHDALSHVGGAQPHLEPVTHRCYQPASELHRSGRRRSRQVLLVPRGPARWPADRDLELGMKVHERLKPGSQPCERHLILAPPLAEFLDAPASGVQGRLTVTHKSSEPPARPTVARVTAATCPPLPPVACRLNFT